MIEDGVKMNFQVALRDLIRIIEGFFETREETFRAVSERIYKSLRSGYKILVFGNGGSAAHAQHFSAELVNKFLKDRPPISAISLTTDTSTMTSIANDTSFKYIFSRQIDALGNRGDIALGLSTSGNSDNILEALKTANAKGLVTIVFTGSGGGKLASLPDFLLDVPSTDTPRIQEVHHFLLHLLAQEIEERMG